jgi:type II secretory pathway pseudopilin PulG
MKRRQNRRSRRNESGYALVMVMFMLAMLVLVMSEAAPTVLSSIQREKEAELVWRGNQYKRGIRLYYLKLNRFPTSLDDLTKPKTGIRFMRQAYKDPMNGVDGSWRLIYVGPNGQLIGSLSDRTISIGGVGGTTAGAQGLTGSSMLSGGTGSSLTSFGSNAMNSANSMNSSGFGSSGFGSNQTAGFSQNGAVGTALANGATPTNSTGNGDDAGPEDPTQPHSLVGSMDASNTIGGNIIGVGSKINKKSFMVYEKAKVYRKFEFIWDPSKDTTVGRASAGIGNQNGINPANSTGNGINPAGMSNSPFSNGANGMNPGQPTQSPASSPNPNNPSPDPNQNPPLQAPPPG